MTNYTTVQGDTFDIIANKVYGRGGEAFTHLIIAENMQLHDVVFFDAGVAVAVPDLPAEVSANLPPWKR